jgi:diguanylate cyclase (GGDEF)-like protein
MQPAESVPTNGRPPSWHEEAAARLEIERLRAIRSRQAAAIEQLTEDVAMFRRAVIALGIRHADARDRGDELSEEPVRLDNLSNVERVVDGARPVASQGPSDVDRRDRQADFRDRTAAIRDDIAERRDADLADTSDEPLRGAVESAAEDRRHAAADRIHARANRTRARRDRLSADHDELTGALTRGTGMRSVEYEIARAKRTGEPLTLAFVDVDGLKAVNDTQGHAVGDALLRNVVTALRSGLRETDLIVRCGGDEFLCVLPGATRDAAADRLELSEAVLAAFATNSLSVGLTEYRAGDDAATLVARADDALYTERGQPLDVR